MCTSTSAAARQRWACEHEWTAGSCTTTGDAAHEGPVSDDGSQRPGRGVRGLQSTSRGEGGREKGGEGGSGRGR